MAVSLDRALGDTRRSGIVEELRGAPDGLDVQTLAGRLGLHPNTVRWHLGVLANAGAVTSSPAPRPTPGRPRILYRLEAEVSSGTRDEYRLLALMLSGTVAALPGGEAAAERTGRSWGRYLVERPAPLARPTDAAAAERVAELLAEQGFAPETAPGEIRMRRCPFHDLAESRPEVVCAVHKGLIDGALEELGSDLEVDELDVLPRPDLCVVRLGRRRRKPSPSQPRRRT